MEAVEVPQTLEYKGGLFNAVPVLEVENFTNWKKRKPEGQWTADERKAANLYQRLKSLIMYVLLDDQNVTNYLIAKSTWDDLILYHEGPSDVKEIRVMDLKLCYNTNSKKDFQDSHGDEEDTRSSHEYLNDLEEEYQARTLLAKSKRLFKKGTQRFNSTKATYQTNATNVARKHKPELRPTKDFEVKYNKVKAKLALLSSSASASKAITVKNKVVFETEVSSDQNGQPNQNDQSAQTDEILNDDLFEHSNHTNNEQIIDNFPNIKDIQIPKQLSSPNEEDTSVQNTILIPNASSSIPSMVTPAPQDRWP
nr:hypothetical protein [Tanacetum cinerariifolium]